MAALNVGFILARRFTLCAFANFVDVLRLAADEGDRSRPILCSWRVVSPTLDPVASSSGVAVRPDERLGDPGPAGGRGREEPAHHDHRRGDGRGGAAAGDAAGARDTGITDLPHLIRVFRAAEGTTPDAFRRAGANS